MVVVKEEEVVIFLPLRLLRIPDDHFPIFFDALNQLQLSHLLPRLPALNLNKEHAVQNQPLVLMIEAHRLRLLKSTSLTDHLKALVEVPEVEVVEWQSDQDPGKKYWSKQMWPAQGGQSSSQLKAIHFYFHF